MKAALALLACVLAGHSANADVYGCMTGGVTGFAPNKAAGTMRPANFKEFAFTLNFDGRSTVLKEADGRGPDVFLVCQPAWGDIRLDSCSGCRPTNV